LAHLTTRPPDGIFANMKAAPLTRSKEVLSDDAILEMVIGRLPERVPAATISTNTASTMGAMASGWLATTTNVQRAIIVTSTESKRPTNSRAWIGSSRIF
jgi:hypothetical protein